MENCDKNLSTDNHCFIIIFTNLPYNFGKYISKLPRKVVDLQFFLIIINSIYVIQ
jgi:hypothetical protein